MSYKAALSPHFSHSVGDGQQIYGGRISGTWCIGAVPHGGYLLGLIVAATADSQRDTPHKDVIHLTAHFLQSVAVADYEIRIRRIRQGKRLSNLDAELVQAGETKITARLVFGVLPDLTRASPSDPLTLSKLSPISRRIPHRLHPAQAIPLPPVPKFQFEVTLAEDPYFYTKNAAKAGSVPSPAFRASDTVAAVTLPSGEVVERDGVFEWAAWCELADSKDVMDASMIPFFSDLQKNLPELLPESHRPGPTWYATVVMSIEFKSKIPSFDSGIFSPRTAGLYSSGRFMTEGRHDVYVEVWTAPGTVGGKERDGGDWREEQVCLAISHQMSLTIPLEKNLQKGAALPSRNSKL